MVKQGENATKCYEVAKQFATLFSEFQTKSEPPVNHLQQDSTNLDKLLW